MRARYVWVVYEYDEFDSYNTHVAAVFHRKDMADKFVAYDSERRFTRKHEVR